MKGVSGRLMFPAGGPDEISIVGSAMYFNVTSNPVPVPVEPGDIIFLFDRNLSTNLGSPAGYTAAVAGHRSNGTTGTMTWSYRIAVGDETDTPLLVSSTRRVVIVFRFSRPYDRVVFAGRQAESTSGKPLDQTQAVGTFKTPVAVISSHCNQQLSAVTASLTPAPSEEYVSHNSGIIMRVKIQNSDPVNCVAGMNDAGNYNDLISFHMYFE